MSIMVLIFILVVVVDLHRALVNKTRSDAHLTSITFDGRQVGPEMTMEEIDVPLDDDAAFLSPLTAHVVSSQHPNVPLHCPVVVDFYLNTIAKSGSTFGGGGAATMVDVVIHGDGSFLETLLGQHHQLSVQYQDGEEAAVVLVNNNDDH